MHAVCCVLLDAQAYHLLIGGLVIRCCVQNGAPGMALVCLFFCAFGAFGYVAGLSSKPIILDCLPAGRVTTVVSLSLVASLITSSPVQVYIISESLEPALFGPNPALWRVCLLRGCLVAITALVAIAVPDFGVFTNLVGNLFTPVIGFLFPPALYLLIRRDRRRARAQAGKPSNADFWGTAKEAWACFVVLVGLCLIVLGMRSFIQDP